MINLDTSVLVRYVTQDDPLQSAAAGRLLENVLTPSQPGYLGRIVLVELAWVLARRYGASQAEIARVVQGLLDAPNLVVESRGLVVRALARMNGPSETDFADALVHEGGVNAGCERTVTFDKRFARTDGVTVLDA